MSKRRGLPVPRQAAMQNQNQAAPPAGRQTTLALQETSFSGPIPQPDDLAAYRDIDPSLLPAIIDMAQRQLVLVENQSRHRQELEKMAVERGFNIRSRSLFYGFVIAMSGLGVATVLAMKDSWAGASIVGGLDITALAALFITGQKKAKRPPREADPTDNE